MMYATGGAPGFTRRSSGLLVPNGMGQAPARQDDFMAKMDVSIDAYAMAAQEGAPEADSLIAEVNAYRSAIPDMGEIPDDWDSAVAWGEAWTEEAGEAWLREQGVPMNQGDLVNAAATYSGDALESSGVSVPGSEYVQLGVLTVDALADGSLSANEGKNIAGAGGAIAGAMICQSFGIPAPIGAYLGRIGGEFIGGVVADLLEDEEHEREVRQLKAEIRALKKEMAVLYTFDRSRFKFWSLYANVRDAVENQWLDRKAGIGLPTGWPHNATGEGYLRFFGISNVTCATFSSCDPFSPRFKRPCDTTDPKLFYCPTPSPEVLNIYAELGIAPPKEFERPFGCFYPFDDNRPFTEGSVQMALDFRNAPHFTSNTEEQLGTEPCVGPGELPGCVSANFGWYENRIRDYQRMTQQLLMAHMRVSADIVHTATLIQTIKANQSVDDIRANYSSAKQAVKAARVGRNVNYGLLGAGGLAAAWLLFGGGRR